MDRIGVVGTMFSCVNMGDIAEERLRARADFGTRFEVLRRTVPGFKDLGVAAKQMIEVDGCRAVVACGMPGSATLDAACAHEASTGILLAQMLTSTHVLEASPRVRCPDPGLHRSGRGRSRVPPIAGDQQLLGPCPNSPTQSRHADDRDRRVEPELAKDEGEIRRAVDVHARASSPPHQCEPEDDVDESEVIAPGSAHAHDDDLVAYGRASRFVPQPGHVGRRLAAREQQLSHRRPARTG